MRAFCGKSWRESSSMKRFFLSRCRSFGHAFAGAWYLLSSQANARLHAVATLLVGAAGLWLGLNRDEWLWIGLAITLVWMAETFNTAIETLCDAVTTKRHPKIKIAKDLGALATLGAAIFAFGVAVLIFGPRLLERGFSI